MTPIIRRELLEGQPRVPAPGRQSVAGRQRGELFDGAGHRRLEMHDGIKRQALDDDTLRFSALSGVRPMIETFPLERAQEAYDRMVSGKARFRVVLTG